MKRTGRGLALTSRFFFTPNGISSPIVRVLSLSADRENSTDDPYAPAYYVGGGNKITKIAIYGPGTVLAGSGNAIYDPKDGTGAAVEFGSPGPSFVAVDGSGNGYVADVEAHTIRSVSSAGVVQTVAGAPRLAGSADGTGAEARFSRPQTLALWGDRVIVADEASLRISVPTLPDTINAPATAPLGVPFQLGTSPRTATSWQWSLIRRPADSNATLSSTTSATPTFTPDVADVYVFRVMATSAAGTSITTAAVSVTQTLDHFRVTADAGAVAGNAASVTVQAVDVADAPMAFTGTIHFTSNDPNATLPADYTFADADHGGHAFAATFRRAGTASITATDIASPLTGTAQLQIAPAATSALTINVPSPVRSGTATTIVVTAHDAFGNVTPEYRGTVQFARSDANDTYPPSYAFTAADAGTKTFLATLRRAGTRSVGVFDVAVVSRNAFAKVIVTSPLVVGDINNDGKSDLFWRDSSTGANSMWLMDGASTLVAVSLPTFTNLDYRIDAVADFDGDAQPDLLWRNYTNGATALWLLNGASIKAVVNLPGLQNLDYHIAGAADFDGNGDPDLIWRNRATGATALWIMNGTSFSSIVNLPGLQNLDYHIAGAADFNGDGSVDIVWRNAVTGANALWLMNRTSFSSIVNLPNLPDAQAGIGAVGDYDGDGMADLVWRNPSTGANTIWKMNGTAFVSAIDLQALTNPSVELVGAK